MRLWHKDLIPYLPRQQLIAQWRECCAIAGSIAKKGTPNHLLVNKIMEFHAFHFWSYSSLVYCELRDRGYKPTRESFERYYRNYFKGFKKDLSNLYVSISTIIPTEEIFSSWHNKRYLLQCLANLSEKYDCGGIPEDEWQIIKAAFPEEIKIIYGGI